MTDDKNKADGAHCLKSAEDYVRQVEKERKNPMSSDEKDSIRMQALVECLDAGNEEEPDPGQEIRFMPKGGNNTPKITKI